MFLIFLNNLSEQSSGGEHQIYSLQDIKENNPSDLRLEQSIETKKGSILIFLNTDKSYHSVNQIINSINKRYFIYGSLNLLAGKNPNIRTKNIPIQWELYY